MLLYAQDEFVADWVCKQLRLKPYPKGLYVAIGIVIDNKLIAGVIWHNYHTDNYDKPLLIEVTLATIDKRWATRHTLKELFQYPFHQLGVKRVQATCSRKAKRVRLTLKRLGFSYEGIVREAHPNGGDAAHYSILKDECKWIRNK
jgi:RimJ/RimL family protein N-acetyltransferase